MRVLDLFTESINSNCNLRAQPCSSRADFQAGRCNTCDAGCANMGYNSNSQQPPNGTYYLSTNGKSPYCKGCMAKLARSLLPWLNDSSC
ncbi:hypothetical protein DPMN_081415 [Dreissena polymorpha]|uniref:Lipase domain-containing protein n=1 Tax=Dreissena polymorpha TaxID=45954 RepID=A0A9D3Y793_DREPO|nr:hypothetical protein DPMN_081415 [Dreissena polymorpha]